MNIENNATPVAPPAREEKQVVLTEEEAAYAKVVDYARKVSDATERKLGCLDLPDGRKAVDWVPTAGSERKRENGRILWAILVSGDTWKEVLRKLPPIVIVKNDAGEIRTIEVNAEQLPLDAAPTGVV